jgi:transcriptional regulator with XRE-family HTH domain
MAAPVAATGWTSEIKRLRREAGLSREEAAARANLSAATLKSYELGSRRPTRESLTALLSALQADPLTRDSVLATAGFAPDGLGGGVQRADPWHSFEEAARAVVEAPIPACLTNQFMEVVAANSLIQRVWEDDIGRDRQGPYERSILAMLTRRSIADHLLNWEEAVAIPISLAKGHYGGDLAASREANPHIAGAVEYLLAGDPPYVQKFLALWFAAEPRAEKYRWWYPIVWQRSTGEVLRFEVVVNPADSSNSVAFNDWIPVDGATAACLERLQEEGGAPPYVALTAAGN